MADEEIKQAEEYLAGGEWEKASDLYFKLGEMQKAYDIEAKGKQGYYKNKGQEAGKKEGKKPKKEKTIPKNKQTTSHIAQDYFADMVISNRKPQFVIVKKDNSIEFCDKIVTDAGKTLEPINSDAVDSRLIKLPELNELPTKQEDVLTLFNEMKTAIKEIYDAGSERNLNIMALWICATYRLDLVGCAPYLRLRGPLGTGKTRGLDVVAHLSLRPISIGPGLTEAVVFRMCEQFKPCCCLNEFDEKSNNEYSSLAIQMLNSRFERGHPIPRVSGENNDKIELFDPYGPTACAMRGSFSDASLESRFFDMECVETDRTDIKAIVNPEEFERRFKPIRDRLYKALRLYYSKEKAGLPEASQMPKRYIQRLTALWEATHPDLLPVLSELIKEMKNEEMERMRNNDEGEIWWALFEKAVEYWSDPKKKPLLDGMISGKDRDEALKKDPLLISGKMIETIIGIPESKSVNGRKGGKILRSMAFKQVPKTKEGRFWVCSEREWMKWQKRVGYVHPSHSQGIPLPWHYGSMSSDEIPSKPSNSEVRGGLDKEQPETGGPTPQKHGSHGIQTEAHGMNMPRTRNEDDDEEDSEELESVETNNISVQKKI